jgi:hypothetical protein
MTASTKSTRNGSFLARLIVSLTMGLMILALGASTAFAATGSHVTQATHNAAPVVSTGGGSVALDEDDDDDDDDDDEDTSGGGGGGLPATDTAPLAASTDSGAPMNALILLVIAGLAGGAVTVAAKRSI